jgi:Mg-chelatase subunit ChlD
MDVSESMKEGLKLCYAKLAAAAVAKTAAADKNRVCIVSFSNTAETVCPLSADLYRISQALLNVQTGKYTNAADAVKTARSLLQKGNATNQKQIIMISDGLPNISSEEELYFQTGNEEMENFGISFGAQSSNQHFHSEVKTEMHTMFKNLNASNAAYKEVKKSREKDIETSFLYIGGDDERGITFAKKVARLGNGTFYHVKDITTLPNKAFQMGCV